MVGTALKLQYLYPQGNPLFSWTVVNLGAGDVITYFDPALGPQPTQAQLDAITDQQVTDELATRAAQEEKAAATQGVDDGVLQHGNRIERLAVCTALVALDAANTERACLTAMNTAVQAATSLADLKTRFAAISFPPQVTSAQLATAIKNKIAATAE